MNKRIICILLFNGFSDWEISYATPELRKAANYVLHTATPDGAPVISAGGLKIIPDQGIADVDAGNIAMLILPGGEAWEQKKLYMVKPLIEDLHKKLIPIAAICGATVGLADAGLLDDIMHTSNAPDYLKAMAPGYNGEKYYSGERAISDGRIITASGIAPVEFAREIFRELKLFDEVTLKKWFEVFKNGTWIE